MNTELVLSIEQAKHLEELGLEMSDALLCHAHLTNIADSCEDEWVVCVGENLILLNADIDEFYNTYTFTELIRKLPFSIEHEVTSEGCTYNESYYLDIDYGMKMISYRDYADVAIYSVHQGHSLLDAAYEMVCLLLENGYDLNK